MLKKILLLAASLLPALGAWAAVDVNQARAMDLDGLKGIGPATSGRILQERDKGPFKDWDDFVARVKGVGKASARRFSDEGLRVNGQPYPQTQETAAPRK
ncbi:ComEA family DNA-binding protein [Xylophilus sp. ASV27]|uniref:ComEA family DNA-binding protein n=1 Tax=Xylophilus sp. ASV27 TaxID=2795129 RepID=UPI0018ECA057|nr:helix-hairpin-helix domain-containing protein [Xylophilus sp. ASV27]